MTEQVGVVDNSEQQQQQQHQDKPFLQVQGCPIYFQEDWGTGIGGGLWSTGAALARYFDTPHAKQQLMTTTILKKNKSTSFLELGSGNGLLSVCWMALLRQQQQHATTTAQLPRHRHAVVVTDMADHLPLIQKTLDANPHIVQAPVWLDVHAVEHTWGEFANDDENETTVSSPLDNRTFDVIVGSDVAYRRELYEPLIASLLHFSDAQKTTILLGCTMADTTPTFFDLLRRAGFDYRRLADSCLPEEYRGQQTFGIFVVVRR